MSATPPDMLVSASPDELLQAVTPENIHNCLVLHGAQSVSATVSFKSSIFWLRFFIRPGYSLALASVLQPLATQIHHSQRHYPGTAGGGAHGLHREYLPLAAPLGLSAPAARWRLLIWHSDCSQAGLRRSCSGFSGGSSLVRPWQTAKASCLTIKINLIGSENQHPGNIPPWSRAQGGLSILLNFSLVAIGWVALHPTTEMEATSN